MDKNRDQVKREGTAQEGHKPAPTDIPEDTQERRQAAKDADREARG